MKIVLLANTDWFLYRFNAGLARALRGAGAEVVLVCPGGEYSQRLVAEGFRWRPWAIERRRLLPWKELATLAALRRILRLEAPDVVHAFTLKCALYGSLVARTLSINARINSITGLGYLFASSSLKATLLRGLLQRVGRPIFRDSEMIFLNRDDLDELTHRGLVQRDRATVIGGSGVDTEAFGSQPWPSDTPPVVVLPSRMLYNKGVEIFVQAAALLRRRGVVARLVLVGDLDPDNPDGISEAQIASWCEDTGVEYWGFTDDMIGVYRQATIVCLPSFYREGVPTVLLEAAACERPLVSTDMPGCRDAVDDGVNGRRVPPRQAEPLAVALEELLASPEMCREMGRQGRRRVIENFSVERVIASTFGVYGRLGYPLTVPAESRPAIDAVPARNSDSDP